MATNTQSPGSGTKSGGTSNRGFAAMDPEVQREIARKGGEAVSRNREHMAEIGRKGGEESGGSRSRRKREREAAKEQ